MAPILLLEATHRHQFGDSPRAEPFDPFKEVVLAAANTSGKPTVPWDYDLPIFVGLVFFLLVAILLFGWNAYTLHRMLANHHHELSRAVGTPGAAATATTAATRRAAMKNRAPGARHWWTKTRLAKLQLFSAIMHVANQIYFLVQHLGRHMDCAWIGAMSIVLYTLMIVPSSAVLILRSTMLVPAWRRMFKRSLLFVLVAVAMALISGSTALMSWDRALFSTLGVCSIQYNRTLNVVGKAVFVCMYLIILLVLVRPMVRHVLEMRKLHTPGMQRSEHSRRLEAVVLSLLIKLVLVILIVTLGSILGILDATGRFTVLEFSLQNVATVYASTLALDRRLRSVPTGSTDDSASITGDDSEDATRATTTGDSGATWVPWSTSSAQQQSGDDTEIHPLSPARTTGPAAFTPGRISLPAPESAAAVAKLLSTSPAPDEKARPAARAPLLITPLHGIRRVPSGTDMIVSSTSVTAAEVGLGVHALSTRFQFAVSEIDVTLRDHASHRDSFHDASSARRDGRATAPEFAVETDTHLRRKTAHDEVDAFGEMEDGEESQRERQPLARRS
ncbi:hypothetical protein AMAG_01122 [Allomyces macrogynus ATCC 38327]|uniref:Uncharacterized protein n=1 Tax=Allomyces macrogynus (strain ATCC 38327) TaxID=578462 RepID=A0A0L0RXT9_ALLM3|nr:hypothetical protein AMAG_01122 [Allomyces macrogynus ATCC 38327]|eukprot:KNE55207.1 hypothetical protein AMAG_01122 [Allomyces macrogynus ATCC 38327]